MEVVQSRMLSDLLSCLTCPVCLAFLGQLGFSCSIKLIFPGEARWFPNRSRSGRETSPKTLPIFTWLPFLCEHYPHGIPSWNNSLKAGVGPLVDILKAGSRSRAGWCMSVGPATWEAEVGGWLETSLNSVARPLLKNRKIYEMISKSGPL